MSVTFLGRGALGEAWRFALRRVGRDEGARRQTMVTIDRLAVRGRIVQGWGWALNPKRRITGVALQYEHDGRCHVLPTEYGSPRHDVTARFPAGPNAAAVGFFLYGLLDEPLGPGCRLRWVVELAEGGHEELSAEAPIVFLDAKRHGGLALGLLRSYRGPGERLLRALLPRESRGESPEAVARDLSRRASAVLVFDHDLGGGANLYRRGLLTRCLAEGSDCVLVRWSLTNLAYEVDVHLASRRRGVTFGTEAALWSWLQGLAIRHVILNNLVSYPAPLALLERLLDFVGERSLPLTVLMHDFQAICPNWTLLGDHGRPCELPEDGGRCEACLRVNDFQFKAVLAMKDMAQWRSVWGRVLERASEVRCFGEPSKTLLLQAYPGLSSERVTVIPHSLEHVRNRAVRFDIHGPIRIGIVGTIAHHKGSEVVIELAAAIRRRRVDARVIVVGTLVSGVRPDDVTITGPYQSAQLPELLERERINICLFPSIWPETFSYVCEEIVQMGMPLVAFDLGAPAARLRTYARGRVVPLCDAEQLLDAILDFVEELRRSSPTHRAKGP